jgi:hypothetical protein
MALPFRDRLLRELEHGSYALAGLLSAMVMAAIFIWFETDGQTFMGDEWNYLSAIEKGESLLAPLNGHLVLLPKLLYAGIVETFGIDSYVLFRLVSIGFNLLCALLLFAWLRRRTADWAAAGASALMLVFGASLELIAKPGGTNAMMSLAAGLGMLLALDRQGPRGDAAACGLLTLSLSSFSIGLPFASGAILHGLLRTASGRWRRAWVWALPLALYAIWTVWSLKYDQTQLSASNIGHASSYVVQSAIAVIAALTGLFRVPGQHQATFDTELATPIALALLALLLMRLSRPAVSRAVWVAAAMPFVYWLSVALAYVPGRDPLGSRYLYPGAVFVLILAAELARGTRLRSWGWVAIGLVLASGLVANIAQLHYGARAFAANGDLVRAELAAVELARAQAEPSSGPDRRALARMLRPHFVPRFVAKDYFSLIDEFGSPAYSHGELVRRPNPPRDAADLVLAQVLRLRLEAFPGFRPPRVTRTIAGVSHEAEPVPPLGCAELRPTKKEPTAVAAFSLPKGGMAIATAAGPYVQVRLRRFGEGFKVWLRRLAGGEAAFIEAPPDAAPQPWFVLVRARQPVRACTPHAGQRDADSPARLPS